MKQTIARLLLAIAAMLVDPAKLVAMLTNKTLYSAVVHMFSKAILTSKLKDTMTGRVTVRTMLEVFTGDRKGPKLDLEFARPHVPKASTVSAGTIDASKVVPGGDIPINAHDSPIQAGKPGGPDYGTGLALL